VEEDAGKLIHDRFPGKTAVDLNRAGTPLAEIVSEPDLRSAAEARAYLTVLRQLLVYAGVSDCSMEKGTLRVDANVSVRKAGAKEFGTKTEVKNLNSFANVERAIEVERERQIALLEQGTRIQQETRLFNAGAGTTKALRSKEESHDYRYFPDPDLPPLILEQAWIEEQRRTMPELPEAKRQRFASEHGLPVYHAATLTLEQPVADFFEKTVAAGAEPKAAADWILETVLTVWNETGAFPVMPDRLAALIALVKDGTVSKQAAKQVYAELPSTSEPPRAIAQRLGLVQVSDAGQLGEWVDAVLAAHPAEVERYRKGEAKLIGLFVGQVMKKSGGKADPKAVQPVLLERLSG
jgi:aspartyl-tRNA(Asn)/glutamyl-tRNA(Gln) amidotransferase subunit B